MSAHPDLAGIEEAARRIADIAVVTPVHRSEALSDLLGCDVWLKLETEQQTGSFKVRGAANTLLQLDRSEAAAGVVAVSSGNHGRAVAHVARRLGIEATICLSSRVPAVKVDAIESLGGRVIVAGPDQDDADAAARSLVAEEGLVFVHPFDDPRVIAGQGTCGLEITDQVPDLSLVAVPLSGGGLAAGIAAAVKGRLPNPRVIGVSQERGPAMVRSLAAGRLVDVVEEDTLADALAGGLGPVNDHSFEMCGRLLDGTVLVSEDEIAAAMAFLHAEGVTAEGGGAVGVAAAQAGHLDASGPIVIVISGGNVAAETLQGVLAR